MKTFTPLYERYRTGLYHYLLKSSGNRELAADLAQETFVRCMGAYAAADVTPTLLYRIARNLFLDVVKKEARVRWEEEAEGVTRAEQESRLLMDEKIRGVFKALAGLVPEERETLLLVISGDLSYREVAAITETSEANVKVRVHRARRHLREILEKEADDGVDVNQPVHRR
ncbi:RNA polymerase sigma factor [Desulfoluna sp.]|uniref:RNA polymerase sigma factor n=1 Tax=Desulfoluna sp. TaxID=2045199 RepID=UPI00262FD29D|nr:RNA polymerase sigma factor [Desulfoluna sp.]